MVRFIDGRFIYASALCVCAASIGCQTFDGTFSGRSLFGSKSKEPPQQFATNAEDSPADADYGSGGVAVADNGFGGNSNRQGNSSANRPNNGSIESELAAGRAALQRKDLNAAKASFRRVVQQQSDNAEAHHQLAIVADLENDFGEAEIRYREAIEHGVNYPKLADLYSDMGFSFLLQERFAASEAALKKALHYNPAHRMAANNYGALYAKVGDRERALAMFRQGGTEAQAQKHMRDFFEQAGMPNNGLPPNGMNSIELANGTNPFANNQPPMNNDPNRNTQFDNNSNFQNPSGTTNAFGATAWPGGRGNEATVGLGNAPPSGFNANNSGGGFGGSNGLGTTPRGLDSNQFANNSGFGNSQPDSNGFGNNALQPNHNTNNSNWGGGNNAFGANPPSSIPNAATPPISHFQGSGSGNNNGMGTGNSPGLGNPGLNSRFDNSSGFNNNNNNTSGFDNSGGFNNTGGINNAGGLNSGPNFNGLNGANSTGRPSVPGTLQPNPSAWDGAGLNNPGVNNSSAQAAMDFANPLLPINSNPGSASNIPSAPLMRAGGGSMHGSQFPQAGQYQPPSQLPGANSFDSSARAPSIPGRLPGMDSGSGFNSSGGGFNNNSGFNNTNNNANSGFNNSGFGNTNTQFSNTNPRGSNTQFGTNPNSPNTNPVSNFQNQMQQFPAGQNTQLGSQPNGNLGNFDSPVSAQY